LISQGPFGDLSLSDWQLLIPSDTPRAFFCLTYEVGFWRKRRLVYALRGRLKESIRRQPYPETMADFNFVG
jgi:hypothetical protein